MVSRETVETIVAIATAPGRGGVGIVRVSGPKSAKVRDAVAGLGVEDRVATARRLRNSRGEVLDDGIVLFFRAPRSFTGEDVVEFQCHGGQAVLARVLRACTSEGCRLANPGEFTERAFHNGKLDLAQAEAVADLIEASSEAAARSAARTLTGEFSAKVDALSNSIIDLRMRVEACIDFPEEELDVGDFKRLKDQLADTRAAAQSLRRVANAGVALRDGLLVALIGRPNVGKSSLLNCLAGQDLAIVTPVAGTTRDAVRTTIHVEGVPIHLVDTAGLRDTEDAVERLGIERAKQEIQKAGAALLVVDAGVGLLPTDRDILVGLPSGAPTLIVYNKIDAHPDFDVSRETNQPANSHWLLISAHTGYGIDRLQAWLLKVAGWVPGAEGVFLARERHLRALSEAEEHLARAAACERQYEFFAEELRLAHQQLSSITGKYGADDLLGEIFGRFCIGK